VSRYQKGKTNLDFTEANDSAWQWHQLGHMQVCTSLQTDNHASIPLLRFFAGRMPFLPPNQQLQSTDGMQKTYNGLQILTDNKMSADESADSSESEFHRIAAVHIAYTSTSSSWCGGLSSKCTKTGLSRCGRGILLVCVVTDSYCSMPGSIISGALSPVDAGRSSGDSFLGGT